MNNFEKQWINKLISELDKLDKKDVISDLLEERQEHTDIAWTRLLMEELKKELTSEELANVMTGCACHYPEENLTYLKDEYKLTKDIAMIHRKLQKQFEDFIRQYKNLKENDIDFLIKNGWGMAGKLEDDRIVAIKIPKDYHKYFQTEDKKEKAFHYCHCPRIREVLLEDGEPIDKDYCYCGAGFYKAIWEYILDRPVKVKVLESIMNSDEVCKIAIYYK